MPYKPTIFIVLVKESVLLTADGRCREENCLQFSIQTEHGVDGRRGVSHALNEARRGSPELGNCR